MKNLIVLFLLTSTSFAHADMTRAGQYLLQVASNSVKEKNYEITQKELQETVRFMHVDQANSAEIQTFKVQIKENSIYQNLNSSTQIEIQKLLADLSDVVISMDEWKAKGLWCRFTLRDNPWEEVSENSFLKNPEAYWGMMPDDEVRKTIAARYERSAIAQCYSSIENDYLYRLGIDPVSLQKK